MSHSLRRRMALVTNAVLSISGLTAGIALACNTPYCDADPLDNCQPTGTYNTATCCRDSDMNGTSHWVTCSCLNFKCGTNLAQGGAFGCVNPGAVCS